MSKKVVFIGAAGEMCQVAVRRFANADPDAQLVLCDIRPELLADLVRDVSGARPTAQKLDLYDAAGLRAVVDGADLVLLGAGPYTRTSAPVIEACIAAEVPYLDFDDDVESTEHALSQFDKLAAAGIPAYIGCGASPGMSNVLAVDAVQELDTVENIDLAWVVGEGGKRVVHESFVETGSAPMGGGLGETLMLETAHPEAVTMPRKWPAAQRIRVIGGLDPAPFNGLGRGVGLAVHEGRMTMKEGIDFLEALLYQRIGKLKGYRAMVSGMRGQVKSGQTTWGAVWQFIGTSLIRKTYPYKGGLLARVYGTKDGKPAVAIRRTPSAGPGSSLMVDMGDVTGAACAAFMLMALDEAGTRAGVFAPEDWAEPQAFYAALVRTGSRADDIVESVNGASPAPARPLAVARS